MQKKSQQRSLQRMSQTGEESIKRDVQATEGVGGGEQPMTSNQLGRRRKNWKEPYKSGNYKATDWIFINAKVFHGGKAKLPMRADWMEFQEMETMVCGGACM